MKYVRMPIEIESPEQMGYAALQCNLTESSVSDALFRDIQFDLKDLVFCYGHHMGKPELRTLIASEYPTFNAHHVLLTSGAATALFIINTSLLEPGDELLVMHPNYGTNIETPRAMGCTVNFIELELENNFRINIQKIKAQLTSKTKLISVTTPHNPTGMMLTEEELKQLVTLAEERNCYLLVDETYRDIPFGKPNVLAASLSKQVISVSSVSKAYGLPGLRIGWLITQNEALMELFLAAKEQISICNSVVDEEMTFQFLQQKQAHVARITNHVNTNFAILSNWLSGQSNFDFVLPQGGVVCFPRLKENIDPEKFYATLNKKYSTYLGPGHWFEMDKQYMRIGFGWPAAEELTKGLANISKTLKEI
ncbi:MAG: pyridoxal phosphate-dependent aminotransferase [Bacteroidetes bacterium]|nr:pyridoxal phosphate-dependent aminotransferase [Bacteroidota bacterium]